MCPYLESPKYSISTGSNRQPFWAVLLAGGDGTRLQSLTLKIAGDSRPKQFCRLVGGQSLLIQTEERLEPLFRRDRTLFVVTRDHERYYHEDLGRADPSRIIVQPQNRGTGVAIATALFRILQREPDPFVAFFPCDHYYSNDDGFVSTIGSAMACAQEYPKSIILLGAEAHYAEIEYGWIEPGFEPFRQLAEILGQTPDRVGAVRHLRLDFNRRAAQQSLDLGHGRDQMNPLLGAERGENGFSDRVGAAVVGFDFIPAPARQYHPTNAAVVGRAARRHEPLPFERSQEPADITGIERQPRAQLPHLRPLAADFVQQPRLAERAAAIEKAVVERADPLGHRTVEAANSPHLIGVHYLTIVR